MEVPVIEKLDIFYDLAKKAMFKYNEKTNAYEVVPLEDKSGQIFIRRIGERIKEDGSVKRRGEESKERVGKLKSNQKAVKKPARRIEVLGTTGWCG